MKDSKAKMNTEKKVAKGGRDDQGRFDFMSRGPVFAVASLLLIVLSIGVISSQGFRYGIDFAGGTEVQIQFPSEPAIAEIREDLESLVGGVMVQTLGDENEILIRMQMAEGASEKEVNEKNNERIQMVTASLKEKFNLESDAIRRVDTVGPQIGSELKTKGLLSVIYSLIIILVYIGLRFDYKYAPAAVICLFHDAMITLGIFSVLGKEVNIQILAAILTIIGYSLNDTIVNFDRIRENEIVYKGKDLFFIVNRSINDVLSRTLLTSVTTLMAVISLYIFAGGVIEDLAFTLAIGVVIGTYSSIYVAAPLVILTEKMGKQWGIS